MSLEIQNNIPLAPFTTLKIGGNARYLVRVINESQLENVSELIERESLRTLVIGGGSNLLISDRGFDGLVILLDIKGRSYEQIEDGQRILEDIKAGEVWDDFVLESVEKGLVGVECLSGIPGKVGGSVVQNIGAYGREISEVIEKVRFYDIETHKFCEYSNTECRFDYRTSVFKGNPGKIGLNGRICW